MENVLRKVKRAFADELSMEGDAWRILRRSTLVDLIALSFVHFQKDKRETHLIDIFNHAMKIKLLSRIKVIEVKGSLDEISKKFNLESEFLLKQYEIIFNDLEPTLKKYSSTNLYDLAKKIQYIKVINELEINSYSDGVFEEIIGIIFNLLHTV